MLITNATTMHVRFNGRSEELDVQTLGLRHNASDAEVRTALARHYDCNIKDLDDYVIVREPQAIIVRPIAIYG